MVEYWDYLVSIGSLSYRIDNQLDLCDKNLMGRKNINREFKKLRVWQDAVSLYILTCKLFSNFPFEFKKVLPIVLTRPTASAET
jgi:hypothetical protein